MRHQQDNAILEPGVVRIIVIGGSAGSQPALRMITGEFPTNFGAAIFVVEHVSPHVPVNLPKFLSQDGALAVRYATDQEPIAPGVLAPFYLFTVPTLRFRILYCFFVIEHGRRKIPHFHATAHPTSDRILQQRREAFALPCPYRYVIFHRDANFSSTIREFLLSSVLKPIRTSIRSPCQNGIAERWAGGFRRECSII